MPSTPKYRADPKLTLRTTTRKGGRPSAVPKRTTLAAFTLTPTALRLLAVARGPYTEGDAIEVLIRRHTSGSGSTRLSAKPPIDDARLVCVIKMTPWAMRRLRAYAKGAGVSRSNAVEWLIRDHATRHLKGSIDAIAADYAARRDRRTPDTPHAD